MQGQFDDAERDGRGRAGDGGRGQPLTKKQPGKQKKRQSKAKQAGKQKRMDQRNQEGPI